MSGFHFEKDLTHQQDAVDSVMGVFHNASITSSNVIHHKLIENPKIEVSRSTYIDNIIAIQNRNLIDSSNSEYRNNNSNVLDISMETGTGKTYAYTKTIFELNKELQINKFIVVVPTLSIKAGTINFLNSKAAKEHFRDTYNRDLKVHVVESQKSGKKKLKAFMPQAVTEFVEANSQNKESINILIINAGMINSKTMKAKFDVGILDSQYSSPFSSIEKIKPITIIDEPHRFSTTSSTWENIQKFGSQYIVRYGATFNKDYKNLLYQLSAVDAFNDDLVKGVVTYIEEFKEGKDITVKLKSIDGDYAKFELNNSGKIKNINLTKSDCFSLIHEEMKGLTIENINTKIVLLSNGLELKPKQTINPFSYSQSLQDKMIEQAVVRHFEIEKDLLCRDIRIKPLTLFFIDDIEGYRESNDAAGSLRGKFERLVKSKAEELLKVETNDFYKKYLVATLNDLSLVHGGYFSKDNSENDEKIEKEIEEILHDKELLLDLNNPRRFIFSKWTLREGWDNPNVFQICKLRSSGSHNSKLQEVGRGLRLPVNEYMSRVKDEKFELHYYVDFTEREFATELANEINEKSGVAEENPTELSDNIIDIILESYPDLKKRKLMNSLEEEGIIDEEDKFIGKGFQLLKELYPNAFSQGLKKGKIRVSDGKKQKVTMRKGKYNELKHLWEQINQKVVLEYKIKNETEFSDLFKGYLLDSKSCFKPQGSRTVTSKLNVEDNKAFFVDERSVNDEILPIVTMSYKEFLDELTNELSINMVTIHNVFIALLEINLNINQYLNIQTVRTIKSGFNKYLLDSAFTKFQIGYQQLSHTVHPTAFSNSDGDTLSTLNSSALGIHKSDERTSKKYCFEEAFYDSELELDNIKSDIEEVIVFTKIPRNSIKIPVAGGGTYSPDFAYIIKTKSNGKVLNLVIETKDKEKRALFKDEQQKIKHAESLFNTDLYGVKVNFETQFSNQDIVEIIKPYIN